MVMPPDPSTVYVIYNPETGALYKHPKTRRTYYASAGSARAALTKACVRGELAWYTHYVTSSETYTTFIEKTETKRNLMTGTEFTQSVNTPMCCDPSTETYWSM